MTLTDVILTGIYLNGLVLIYVLNKLAKSLEEV